MAIEPAAISARPAVMMMRVESTAPERPAASANGTVRPADMPITMSRTVSPAVKWRSICGVCGTASLSGSALLIFGGRIARSHHQHRRVRGTNYPFGHTPHHPPVEARPPVRGHHHQIVRLLVEQVQQPVNRAAV